MKIDNNNPPDPMPYEIANSITSNAYSIFKNSDHAICLGGK